MKKEGVNTCSCTFVVGNKKEVEIAQSSMVMNMNLIHNIFTKLLQSVIITHGGYCFVRARIK